MRAASGALGVPGSALARSQFEPGQAGWKGVRASMSAPRVATTLATSVTCSSLMPAMTVMFTLTNSPASRKARMERACSSTSRRAASGRGRVRLPGRIQAYSCSTMPGSTASTSTVTCDRPSPASSSACCAADRPLVARVRASSGCLLRTRRRVSRVGPGSARGSPGPVMPTMEICVPQAAPATPPPFAASCATSRAQGRASAPPRLPVSTRSSHSSTSLGASARPGVSGSPKRRRRLLFTATGRWMRPARARAPTAKQGWEAKRWGLAASGMCGSCSCAVLSVWLSVLMSV